MGKYSTPKLTPKPNATSTTQPPATSPDVTKSNDAGPERTQPLAKPNDNPENAGEVKKLKASEIISSRDKITKLGDYGIGIEEAPKRSGVN